MPCPVKYFLGVLSVCATIGVSCYDHVHVVSQYFLVLIFNVMTIAIGVLGYDYDYVASTFVSHKMFSFYKYDCLKIAKSMLVVVCIELYLYSFVKIGYSTYKSVESYDHKTISMVAIFIF